MAGTIVDLDAGYSAISGEDTPEKQIKTVREYLYILLEQLRYVLRNIGLENMNEAAVKELTKLITDPVYARIEDDEGKLTEVALEAGKISLIVSDGEQAGEFTLTPAMARLVCNVIELYGAVTFHDTGEPGMGGTTTILGDSITTGTIHAEDLNLEDTFMLVHEDAAHGFIGCGQGNDGSGSTYGAYMAGPVRSAEADSDCYIIVTNKGIRFSVSGNDSNPDGTSLYLSAGHIVASQAIEIDPGAAPGTPDAGAVLAEEGEPPMSDRLDELERQVAYLTARLAEQEGE